MIAEGWGLYCCVAIIEPDNLPQSDSGLVQRSWRDLPSRSGIATVPIKTTPTSISHFLSSDTTEMSFIPPRSRRGTQYSPAIASRIGAMVVDNSSVELWAHPHPTIQPCNLMNTGRGGMELIPLRSWRRALPPPAIRFRIGPTVIGICH